MTKDLDILRLIKIEQIVQDEFQNLLPLKHMMDADYEKNFNLIKSIIITILSNFMSSSSLWKQVPYMSQRTLKRKIGRVIDRRSYDKVFDVCYQKSLSRANFVYNYPTQKGFLF